MNTIQSYGEERDLKRGHNRAYSAAVFEQLLEASCPYTNPKLFPFRRKEFTVLPLITVPFPRATPFPIPLSVLLAPMVKIQGAPLITVPLPGPSFPADCMTKMPLCDA